MRMNLLTNELIYARVNEQINQSINQAKQTKCHWHIQLEVGGEKIILFRHFILYA